MGLDHDHEHEHDHSHEHDPLAAAIDPPAEELLAALRGQWLRDQEFIAELKEQLVVASTTVDFQNRVIAGLQEQLQGVVSEP